MLDTTEDFTMMQDIDPPAIRRPATDLATIAHLINDEHAAVEGASLTTLEHAHAAGQLLLEAKQAVGHGNWLDWVAKNVKFSVRTAQRYIRLAEKYDTVTHLTDHSEALRMLAAKERPTATPAPSGPTAARAAKPTPGHERQLDRLRKLGDFASKKLTTPKEVEMNIVREFAVLPPARRRKALEKLTALRAALEMVTTQLAALTDGKAAEVKAA